MDGSGRWGIEFRERDSLAGLYSDPGGRMRTAESGSVRNRSERAVQGKPVGFGPDWV